MGEKTAPVNTSAQSWGSRIGLVLAMAGNAVGFGNFLRFPVQAIENGGGAFIIPYLVCLVLLGLPLLLIEWSSGRFGGKFRYHSSPFIMMKMGQKPLWMYVGVFGIFSNLVIISFYTYMESWTIAYVYHSLVGTFQGMDQAGVASFFNGYLDVTTSTTGIPYEALIFFLICLGLNVWILSRGIQRGVEAVAKIVMPVLILFGMILAYKAITLKAGQGGAVFNGLEGLNFLWTPHFESIWNPKVWLAAAGQIFFTLSVGMGAVQAYASFVKPKQDIAGGAMAAGFMNQFVEIVLGGSILIPIAIGYFGIDKVVEITKSGGLGLAFQSLPFLFTKWGPVLSFLGGALFFGLLFFAGITSTLAMGTSIINFLRDEFKVAQRNAALILGATVLTLGLPTIFFFQDGVFGEYDYWGGTIALVIFGMLESILFAWVFGLKRGWAEITEGADVQLPRVFIPIIKYVTPVMLIIIFVGAAIRPANDDWSLKNIGSWELHGESIIGKIIHKGIGPNNRYFDDAFYAEAAGVVEGVSSKGALQVLSIRGDNGVTAYQMKPGYHLTVKEGDRVDVGSPIFRGNVVNRVFFIDMTRVLLLLIFVGSTVLVYVAYRRRIKEKRLV